ncbi:P-loop containing nucleoside triphosphate hydrolase protein [Cyathus striatus]|nr:P-loop containing nucleoside triphosphate hydrolase protein [Cyathus striatus]
MSSVGSDIKWKKGKAYVKQGDNTIQDGKPDDIVVAIMGPTGAGKSTFVNALLGKQKMKVGHQLESCTANLEHEIVPHPTLPNRRLVILDTPGFDDTEVDDAEILRRISVWLGLSYAKRMKLGGVIYLHEISQTRMLGTSRQNLDMFKELCGTEAMKSVILGTTKWTDVSPGLGASRENQLRETYWAEFLKHGSSIHRFSDSDPHSAWEMVNEIIGKTQEKELQLQKELVEVSKFLPDTKAGQKLKFTLEQHLRMKQDPSPQEKEKIAKAIKKLKVGVPDRIKDFFGLVSVRICFICFLYLW